jgi:hypothetical protein
MVMVKVLELLPPGSLAEMVTVKAPVAVGVPLITPVAALTLKPAGRLVAWYESA